MCLVSPCLNSFVYFVSTPVEIENIIKSFKNKTSPINEILSNVFKHISIIISQMIYIFKNCSVNQGNSLEWLKWPETQICCRNVQYKTKTSFSFHYFDICFMNNIGGASDRYWHDYLSLYYTNKESCHRLSETPPIVCIKHLSK